MAKLVVSSNVSLDEIKSKIFESKKVNERLNKVGLAFFPHNKNFNKFFLKQFNYS